MEAAIEVTDLVVERGRRRVLHGISCAVPAGSVTGLLGPSGSGKTTLIRAVVGVQIVKSGTVTVLGRPAGSATLRRDVGYVTQAPSVKATSCWPATSTGGFYGHAAIALVLAAATLRRRTP